MRITGSLFPRCVVVVDILDWALWEYHNQVNANVRQAPSSQYEEREAVPQLSVCDFSSRAFAGASSWLGIGGVTFRYPHPQMLLMTLTPAH